MRILLLSFWAMLCNRAPWLETLPDRFRMFSYVIVAVGLFALATLLITNITLQTQVLKLVNVCLAAWIGYWIDRHAFRHARVGPDASDTQRLRRAIIIAACVLAVGLGV